MAKASRQNTINRAAISRETAAADPAFVALSGANRIDPDAAILRDDAKLIAFYLPQFHQVIENSEWWGEGFTEWNNVRRARPNFEGHGQPKIPREIGYYDLADVSVMRRQAELARLYGVHGFCFYHYWFSGRRILEKPVEQFLASDIDMPFCLCWANENWTRTWDGDTKSVLLEQKYLPEDAAGFIKPLIQTFRDPRYIKVDGKPLLLVYRAKHIPDPKAWFATWRDIVKTQGFAGLHIAVVDMHDMAGPAEVSADALVEFPPHRFGGPQAGPKQPPVPTNPDFAGTFVDYTKIIAQSAQKPSPDYAFYRGIIPAWDNTARRQNNATIVVGAVPNLFGAWLRYLRAYTRSQMRGDDNFIFVNAWNEWGEGCTLEPDQRWGLGYLEEVFRSAFRDVREPEDLLAARENLLGEVAALLAPATSDRALDQRVIDEIAASLAGYKPQSSLAQNLSERLRQWPLAHRIARATYRIVARMRP